MQFEAQDVMVPWHLQPKYVAGTSQDQSITNRRRTKNNEKVRERKRLKKAQKKLRKTRATAQESTKVKSEDDESQIEYLFSELSALDWSDEDIKTSSDKTDQGPDMLCYTEAMMHNDVDTAPNKGEIMTLESPQRTSICSDDSGATNAPEEVESRGYQTFQRYYHVFRRGELVQLFTKCSDAIVLEEFYDHENWCVIAKKI